MNSAALINDHWIDNTQPRDVEEGSVIIFGHDEWIVKVEDSEGPICGKILPGHERGIGLVSPYHDAICLAVPFHEHPHLAFNQTVVRRKYRSLRVVGVTRKLTSRVA